METKKLLDLSNDGLNLAADKQFLYIRCMRDIYKFNFPDMCLAAQNTVFKKQGKARTFSVCDKFIFLTDFCDLHVIQKKNLQIIETVRIGKDLTSDIGTVRFSGSNAYIAVRNGKMAVVDIETRKYVTYEISDSSFWDHTIDGEKIYAGTVQGEMIAIAPGDMTVIKKAKLSKKNIYSVVADGDIIYAVSNDRTIAALNAGTFQVVCTAKKAVGSMAKILGLYKDLLVAADSNKVSFWDKKTLRLQSIYEFPTGLFNKGVILHGNKLYGSDYNGVYSTEFDKN